MGEKCEKCHSNKGVPRDDLYYVCMNCGHCGLLKNRENLE